MSGLISNHPQLQCAYNAAKAGVIMLTKSLAGEWAGRGVRVNSVSPGYINTPMTPRDSVRRDWYEIWMTFSPTKRIGEPTEIAPAVAFLASDASSFFNGATWSWTGATHAGRRQTTNCAIKEFATEILDAFSLAS